MAEFKKKKINSFWHSPLALGVLFCILVLFSYNMIGLVEKERDTAQKKALILDQIDNLNKREGVLRADIAKIQTEEGIEDVIREKYQVVKPGEKMVVIVDDKKEVVLNSEEKNDHTFLGWIKKTFSK